MDPSGDPQRDERLDTATAAVTRTMRLPDFLIVGAQKGGTTWLRRLLRGHPEIFMPASEIHYFDHPDLYQKGVEWYADHFREARPDQLVGEKTPNYLYLPARPGFPEGARRIHDLLPEARLVVVLRDPVNRALSALNHLATLGEVSPLLSADELLLGPRRYQVPWPVIDMGKYDEQVPEFFELYGRENVLVFFFEDDVVGDPASTLARTCDFLGVSRLQLPTDRLREPVNRPRSSKLSLVVKHYAPFLYRPTLRLTWRFPAYYPRLSEEGRRRLYELFEPHNQRLFEVLGRRPSSGWTYRPGAGRG